MLIGICSLSIEYCILRGALDRNLIEYLAHSGACKTVCRNGTQHACGVGVESENCVRLGYLQDLPCKRN